MANVLKQRPEQVREADQLAEDARFLGKKVLSATTMSLAPALVKELLTDNQGGPIGEAAADIRMLRSDGRFNASLNRDISISQEILTYHMLAALQAGFHAELEFQKTQIKGLSFVYAPEDEQEMRDYPIQGHTCAEISDFMHRNFKYDVQGLLASPLVGDCQIESLPDFVGSATAKFGDKFANAVDEAYFAGVQMALRGVAKAIGVA